MASTICPGTESVGRWPVAPGRRIGLDGDPVGAALTMATRLAPIGRCGLAPRSQERQAGREIALELSEWPGPAQQGGEALDAEAGPQERDHGPIVAPRDPSGRRSARAEDGH